MGRCALGPAILFAFLTNDVIAARELIGDDGGWARTALLQLPNAPTTY